MAPTLASIALVNVTASPPTWSFGVLGTGFEPGAVVRLTPPGAAVITLHDADILSVTPEFLRFLTTNAHIGVPGVYTVAVRNPTLETSAPLSFEMQTPGVIVRPVAGYLHHYGYAFVRPPLPNTTNAPLGLAPGATVTVYQAGTTTPATLYSDAAGATPATNPLTADAYGFYSFYFVPATVDIQFSGGGILVPYTIGDAVPLDPRVSVLEVAVEQLEQVMAVTQGGSA